MGQSWAPGHWRLDSVRTDWTSRFSPHERARSTLGLMNYPEGTTIEEGVSVSRFSVDHPRSPDFAASCRAAPGAPGTSQYAGRLAVD